MNSPAHSFRKARDARPFLAVIFLLASILPFTGCASARESVQWEFKSEKEELAPHEARRADAYYLADPDNR